MISEMMISALLFLQLSSGVSFADERIPPTRTLGSDGTQWGRLIVFSEPPGLNVVLDNEEVGTTPLWLFRVEEGIHRLRVADQEAEIFVEQGKRVKAGFFKGSFITSEEEDVAAAPAPEPDKPEPMRPAVEQPPEEVRKRDLTRWDLFLNGSLRFF
jgi:hypothetical protein